MLLVFYFFYSFLSALQLVVVFLVCALLATLLLGISYLKCHAGPGRPVTTGKSHNKKAKTYSTVPRLNEVTTRSIAFYFPATAVSSRNADPAPPSEVVQTTEEDVGQSTVVLTAAQDNISLMHISAWEIKYTSTVSQVGSVS